MSIQSIGWGVAGAVLLALLGAAGGRAQPYLAVPEGIEGSAGVDWDSRAQCSLFGEFRTSLSDFFVLKADRTFHRGVMIRHLTDEEIARLGKIPAAHTPMDGPASDAAHEQREHHSETTVLPARGSDWRGLLGAAHREVEPMINLQHHKHASPRQTAALYRLTVRANPHLEHAYVDGSFVMRSPGGSVEEAVRFLEQGERCNPRSVTIQTELGHILFLYLHDRARAEEHLRRAIALAGVGRNLSDDDDQARIDAYRWLALLYQHGSQPVEAVHVAQAGEAVIGRDVTLEQVLRHKGLE